MKINRIDQNELFAFRLALPEHFRDEIFQFLSSRYDVTKALYLAHKLKLKERDIDVKDWAKSLGLDGPKDESGTKVSFIAGISDSDALSPGVDVKRPVILVYHFWKEKGKEVCGGLIIDGNKRLRRAFLEGLEVIPGYVLPKWASKMVRL